MDCRFVNTAVEPFGRKVASGLCMALQCYQHLGQGTLEQLAIEKIVGFLESLIFSDGNGCCLHSNCIVPYNFSPIKNRYTALHGCSSQPSALPNLVLKPQTASEASKKTTTRPPLHRWLSLLL